MHTVMKRRSHLLSALTVVGIASIFAMPAVSSHAQLPQGPPPGLGDNLGQFSTEQVKARRDAWLNKRVPHPACPNCFTVEEEFGISEMVPGSDQVITRDLPDPAPLELGEVRATVHPVTGEPLWYKGQQAFVGPTDEEPWSASLPIPLIELKRIKRRHDAELRKIDGVHSISIGETGFIVEILPEKRANRRLIPPVVEGIPMVVEETEVPIMAGHAWTRYRPVPVGAGGLCSTLPTGSCGTVGPHLVRSVADIGICCQLYTLTAGHVIQDMSFSMPTGRIITQGGSPYGFFGFMFQLTPCFGPGCTGPLNEVSWRPDAAAIGHDTSDHMPMHPPCNGAQKPVRRMQHGVTSYNDGPSGAIRIPTMSSCSSNCLRTWGMFAHRPTGRFRSTDLYTAVQQSVGTVRYYYVGPLDTYTSTSPIITGDSGSLVAWDSSRDVTGLVNAVQINNGTFVYAIYQRLDHIQLAFLRANVSYNHYWGTGTAYRGPSNTATDPLNPSPCSQ